MAKERLCLTGASGFLGGELVDKLAITYDIKAISRIPIHVKGIREYAVGNLKDDDFLKNALKKCGIVVHVAAVTNTIDPELEEINVRYTDRLINAAKSAGVKKVVYISSENVTYQREDPYTLSKKEAEKIVLKKYKDALILRP